ncbi:protein cornichon homolog 4 [Panicum hallii]|nr:protein cornichon homolog 4 [Panicum hallii]
MQPLAKYASEHLTDRPARLPPTRSSSPPRLHPDHLHLSGGRSGATVLGQGSADASPKRESEASAPPGGPGRLGGKAEMVFVWLTAFFLVVALIVLVIYQLMCLADLEFDYINPFDSSSRINKVIMPEFVLQALLSVLFLLSGHWAMFLLSVPMVYYNYTLYQRRQHLVDVTEIFNQLGREKKRRLFKIVSLIVLLFLSLFWMIWSVLSEEDE